MLLGCGAVICDVTTNVDVSEPSFRLNTHVLPESYDIWLKPYMLVTDGARQFTFDGEVNITLHSTNAGVHEITLNKNLIEITDAWLYNNNDATRLIQFFGSDELIFDELTQKLTVPLQDQLTLNNNYTLRIVYTGQIRDGLQGFFRANYTDGAEKEKWVKMKSINIHNFCDL